MPQIGRFLSLFLLIASVAAQAADPPKPPTLPEAKEALRLARENLESAEGAYRAGNSDSIKALHEYATYRTTYPKAYGKPGDPWYRPGHPQWDEARNRELMRNMDEQVAADLRRGKAVADAKEALKQARDDFNSAVRRAESEVLSRPPVRRPPAVDVPNTSNPRPPADLGETLPQQTPRLQGPNTRGPRTLPGEPPFKPGQGIDPEDFWAYPWKKPPC